LRLNLNPRRAAIAAGTAAVTALALTGALVGLPAGAAAPGEPTLNLWAPASSTGYYYGGGAYLESTFKVVAGDVPVEIRAHRTSYDQPISAELVSPGGNVALPADAMQDFTGLTDFITVTVTKSATGRTVVSYPQNACLNGYSERTSPEAPARSPYPLGCPYNPYTVGSVMGVQSGHAVGLDAYYGGQDVDLKPGEYDISATVKPEFASLFHMTTTTATSHLTVLDQSDCRRGCRTTPRTAATRDALAPHRTAPTSPSAGTFDGPKPDLRTLPPWQLQLNRKGTALRFAATEWNAGPSPMVIEGFRNSDDEDSLTTYEYFFDGDGNQVGYQQVGTMHWHAGNHNHWHFEDFATYDLLDSSMNRVVKSTKNSFCLANTDPVDYTVPGADWKPENTDLSSACGDQSALSVREVLSSGSGDTYYQFRTGQAFKIKGLPDGVYYIRITVNPNGNLLEENYDNNSATRKVVLKTNQKGERRIKVAPVGIIDENGIGYY
jgi:hypothetical protein